MEVLTQEWHQFSIVHDHLGAWKLSLGASVDFLTLRQLRQFLTDRARAQEQYEKSTNKTADHQKSSHSNLEIQLEAQQGFIVRPHGYYKHSCVVYDSSTASRSSKGANCSIPLRCLQG
ncbi:Protein of unknown function [Cotesia congregata]|uniref:Uncharacterized protein n=1 Tax=Cotesia congregata TaxID=51543 RepID=A0A8J2H5F9_COTCN|nr:Protein of unknown function [Cotesia congregata]